MTCKACGYTDGPRGDTFQKLGGFYEYDARIKVKYSIFGKRKLIPYWPSIIAYACPECRTIKVAG